MPRIQTSRGSANLFRTSRTGLIRVTTKAATNALGPITSYDMKQHHPIFRIWPNQIRSERAFVSWQGYDITDIPAVEPVDKNDKRCREIACSKAHAAALTAFLGTGASHGIILEDDAILHDDTWLNWTGFDLFFPFKTNRAEHPVNLAVVPGFPGFGTFAYKVSCLMAVRWVARLEQGGVADVCHRDAARGLNVAHLAGNACEHDIHAKSTIDEPRRLWHIAQRRKAATAK